MTPDAWERGHRRMSRRRMLQWLGVTGAAWATGATPPFGAGARGVSPPDSPVLHTRLTEAFRLACPVVGAGMGFVGMPPLVAAVSNAGGLGVLGNAIEPPPSTQRLIQAVKAMTDKPFGIDFFLATSTFGPVTVDAHIDIAIAEQVPLVVFHFDIPPKAFVDRLHGAGILVWAQVPSVEDAKAAVQVGVDALIAQGIEAGGHNKSTTPLLPLLREIRDAVDVMVLAAGGIATGADVVRALDHGAEGVWVGSRLVASEEAHAHPEYKRRLVEAKSQDTVITTMFGPELPDQPYRVLRNRVVNAFAGHEGEIPDPPPPPAIIGQTLLFPLTLQLPYDLPKFSAIVPSPETVGDFEEMGLPAEESVHAIKSIKPVAQIIADLMVEARLIVAGELGGLRE
jgi:NAD(P)H-dependent flavin oxidoreductase YrpB (nitropropane dioxygenase family)